ncbi:MAG: thioredoxin domain-containing protein [Proteobacteria bacterium]|nr:thioredoxin domain-containing protein [Pseudomonadota bacterium]
MKLALAPLILAALAGPAVARPAPDPAKTYAITLDPLDATVGPADAKVTIIEASDYACPYCERIRPTMAKLRAKYGKDLRIVYKQLVVHPTTATASALAACAAAKQHKFAAMDEALWQAYQARTFDTDDTSDPNRPVKCWDSPAGCPFVNAAAKQAGVNVTRLQADMPACLANVEGARKLMARFSVSAIPTVFINGRFLQGAQPLETFEQLVDEELAKATTRITQGAKPATYYQQWVIDQGETQLDPATTAPPSAPPPPLPHRRVEPDADKTYAIKVDADDATLGPADAKITMILACDYASPYCEKVRDTIAKLRTKYGKDLRLVAKQLVVHPRNTMASALAACAANRQGKFAAMDALLWDAYKARAFDLSDEGNVKCWEAAGTGCTNVTAAAQAAKLDLARFKTDMIACQASVATSMTDLAAFNVAATPSFFINGRFLSGAQPQEVFERLIDEELAKATTRIKQGTRPAAYYQKWIVEQGLTK